MEDPSTQLTFLGIAIDTDNMTAGISPEHKKIFSHQYNPYGKTNVKPLTALLG